MGANVTIEEKAFADPRFDVLGKSTGVDGPSALGRMARVWRWCTRQSTYVITTSEFDACYGIDGAAAAACTSGLAEHTDVEGTIRVCGTQGKIEWLAKLRKNSRKGGAVMKAKSLARKKAKAKPKDKPNTGQSLGGQKAGPPTPTTTTSTTGRDPTDLLAAEPAAQPEPVTAAMIRSPEYTLGSSAVWGDANDLAIDVLAEIAATRQRGISAALLHSTVDEFRQLALENLSAFKHGLEQVLGSEGFDFSGKPSRVINYVKACMRGYRPTGSAPTGKRRGPDPNNLSGDDLGAMADKLRAEGR